MLALIVGAGFGGIGMGVALKRAGLDQFLIIEKGDGPGGVWRDNTYPGAACDVPSHLYSYSFEPWPNWSRRYAPQPEIHHYLRHCVDKYQLRDNLRSGVSVVQARFDAQAKMWVAQLSDGKTVRASFLIPACGQLSEPSWPAIPGLEDFSGQLFHSARWDQGVDFAGKRVGVIGTGASAVQFVPEVARHARSLVLFQRSPAYVLPKLDWSYGNWRHRMWRRWPWTQRLARWVQYWSHELRGLMLLYARPLVKIYEWRYRWILSRRISDRALRRELMPDDPLGCKRILFSNHFLRALDQPNVSVETAPITEIDATGVQTDRAHHACDVLILGTGFKTTEFLSTLSIKGANGEELAKRWQDGARAHLGMAVSGFPNLLMLYGPNTNLGHNSIIFMLERQIEYIVQALTHWKTSGRAPLDVDPNVERAFDEALSAALEQSIWSSGCANWYRADNGRVVNNWPWSTLHYTRETRRFNPEHFSNAEGDAVPEHFTAETADSGGLAESQRND